MNALHRYVCNSRFWKSALATEILPWVLEGIDLGGQVLEIGPGPGAATDLLHARAGHLTCVEIDTAFATRLRERTAAHNVTVLCEDATAMSLASGSMDGAISLTMLHHIPSTPLQDRLLEEVARVLRPGGIFAGFDIRATPLSRLLHVFDTMVAVDPRTFAARLATAGFDDIAIDIRSRGFRFRAVRRPT